QTLQGFQIVAFNQLVLARADMDAAFAGGLERGGGGRLGQAQAGLLARPAQAVTLLVRAAVFAQGKKQGLGIQLGIVERFGKEGSQLGETLICPGLLVSPGRIDGPWAASFLACAHSVLSLADLLALHYPGSAPPVR